MKKLIQKIFKHREANVNFIFEKPVITREYILFGKFIISKTIKNA